MNILSPHIPVTQLADIADGKSQTPAEVLQHLASCSLCADQLQTLRQTIALMRSDATEDAPLELLNYAKNVFRSKVARQVPALAKLVLAALTFDSLTAEPAFGLRSQANAGRQLVYSTDTADIDVRVSPQDEQWQLAGQILGSDCSAGEIELLSESFSASAKLNELCEFSFDSVPGGTYKISVRLPDLLIETPQLEIGP